MYSDSPLTADDHLTNALVSGRPNDELRAAELERAGYAEGSAEAERLLERGASRARLERLVSNYAVRAAATEDLRLLGRMQGAQAVLELQPGPWERGDYTP